MGVVKEQTAATSSSASTKVDDGDGADVGQGELYSPEHAIKIKATNTTESTSEQEGAGGKMMKMKGAALAADIRRNLGVIKEKVLEKLAAASVPADALENARHFLESSVRDVTVAAHGLTMDALHRIKSHLVDILPSLSPAITRKMVDDAEKEANEERENSVENKKDEQKQEGHQQHTGKSPYVSPASSLFAIVKPLSRL